MRAAVSPKEERREGFWYGDEGEDKSGLEAGKRRSAQCTRTNGADTDGIRGARGDSDPACVAWSSWAQCLGIDIHSGFSKQPLLPKDNFS